MSKNDDHAHNDRLGLGLPWFYCPESRNIASCIKLAGIYSLLFQAISISEHIH